MTKQKFSETDASTQRLLSGRANVSAINISDEVNLSAAAKRVTTDPIKYAFNFTSQPKQHVKGSTEEKTNFPSHSSAEIPVQGSGEEKIIISGSNTLNSAKEISTSGNVLTSESSAVRRLSSPYTHAGSTGVFTASLQIPIQMQSPPNEYDIDELFRKSGAADVTSSSTEQADLSDIPFIEESNVLQDDSTWNAGMETQFFENYYY